MEFSLQEDVQGYLLQREIWKYGELAEESIAAYGGADSLEALYIGHKQEKNSEGAPEITWELLRERRIRQGKPFSTSCFPRMQG